MRCSCGGDDCPDPFCDCRCHRRELLEPVKRTYDADELGIDQEDD